MAPCEEVHGAVLPTPDSESFGERRPGVRLSIVCGGDPSHGAGDYTEHDQHSREGYGQREYEICFYDRFVHCDPLYRTNPDRRYRARRARLHRGSNSPALAICAGDLAANL